jgi:hypothetical protein
MKKLVKNRLEEHLKNTAIARRQLKIALLIGQSLVFLIRSDQYPYSDLKLLIEDMSFHLDIARSYLHPESRRLPEFRILKTAEQIRNTLLDIIEYEPSFNRFRNR